MHTEKKLFHLDIKPENIMISKYGIMKLIDIEFLRIDDGKSTMTCCGTKYYNAPEIEERPIAYNSKVDMYALGRTLLYLYSKLPASLMVEQEEEILDKMKEFPILHEICRSYLQTDPNDRFSAENIIELIPESIVIKHRCRTIFYSQMSFLNDREFRIMLLKKENYLIIKNAISDVETHDPLYTHRFYLYQFYETKKKEDTLSKLKKNEDTECSKLLCIYLFFELDEYEEMVKWAGKANFNKFDIESYVEGATSHGKTQLFLGYCHEHGIGFTKDLRKAAEHYEIAAISNDRTALFKIANCYHMGLGVTKSAKKSLKYFQFSADLGHPEAEKMIPMAVKNCHTASAYKLVKDQMTTFIRDVDSEVPQFMHFTQMKKHLKKSIEYSKQLKPRLILWNLDIPYILRYIPLSFIPSSYVPHGFSYGGVQIGNTFLQWNEYSIVDITKDITTIENCTLVMDLPMEKLQEKMINDVCEVISHWNLNEKFSVSSANYQHFVNDLVQKGLGITEENMFTTSAQQLIENSKKSGNFLISTLLKNRPELKDIKSHEDFDYYLLKKIYFGLDKTEEFQSEWETIKMFDDAFWLNYDRNKSENNRPITGKVFLKRFITENILEMNGQLETTSEMDEFEAIVEWINQNLDMEIKKVLEKPICKFDEIICPYKELG